VLWGGVDEGSVILGDFSGKQKPKIAMRNVKAQGKMRLKKNVGEKRTHQRKEQRTKKR
jgi:hypothetical protein